MHQECSITPNICQTQVGLRTILNYTKEDLVPYLIKRDNGLLISIWNVRNARIACMVRSALLIIPAAAATSALVKTLEAAIDKVSQVSLKEYNIAAHSMLDKQGRKVVNLHLSLSRPIQLWTGQRGDFIAACRRALLDTNG